MNHFFSSLKTTFFLFFKLFNFCKLYNMNTYKTCTYCYVYVLFLFRLILLIHSFMIKSELKILLEKTILFRTMYLH